MSEREPVVLHEWTGSKHPGLSSTKSTKWRLVKGVGGIGLQTLDGEKYRMSHGPKMSLLLLEIVRLAAELREARAEVSRLEADRCYYNDPKKGCPCSSCQESRHFWQAVDRAHEAEADRDRWKAEAQAATRHIRMLEGLFAFAVCDESCPDDPHACDCGFIKHRDGCAVTRAAYESAKVPDAT